LKVYKRVVVVVVQEISSILTIEFCQKSCKSGRLNRGGKNLESPDHQLLSCTVYDDRQEAEGKHCRVPFLDT
jgi:hypothetical protein